MTPFVSLITKLLAIGTIAMQIAMVYVVYCVITKKTKILTYLEIFGSKIALLLSLGALAASYFYSAFANFIPCSLCYVQRYTYIVLAILFLSSRATTRDPVLLKINNRILYYFTLLVTSFGILVSSYHSILQMNPTITNTPTALCALLHSDVSCSLRYFYEFNYISMPVMSLSGFLLIFAILIASRKP